MSWLHWKGDLAYIVNYKKSNNKCGRALNYQKVLGRISKEKANIELNKWIRQSEIKPIYRTIIIDPPWEIEKIEREVRPNQKAGSFDRRKTGTIEYPTMSIDEIKKFPVPRFVSKDGAFLFIWTIQKYLPDTFEILKEWGFNYVCTLVWHKNGGFQPFNLPQYNAEFVIFANKGSLKFSSTKDFSCIFNGERREHSRKPDEFYNTLRRVAPDPRIDIFGRDKKEGFDTYGYESDKFE